MAQLLNWRTLATAFTVATIVYAFRTKQSHGSFMKVPFEFRVPTTRRFKNRFWNADDPRLFTPHVFGIGWSLNLYQVRKRLQGAQRQTRLTQPPRSDG